jgi:hypothetical protein
MSILRAMEYTSPSFGIATAYEAMQLESVWLNRTNHDVALLNIGFARVKEGSKPCPLCWLLKNVQIQGARNAEE